MPTNETGPQVVVYHQGYGCETGCCGHVVRFGDDEKFLFEHPYGDDAKEFVRRVVTAEFGEQHVADIAWDDCLVSDD